LEADVYSIELTSDLKQLLTTKRFIYVLIVSVAFIAVQGGLY